MEVEHAYSAILAIILGIVFTTAFYGIFDSFLTIIENPAKMFVAIIMGVTLARITLFIPFKQLTQDEN